MCKPRPLQKSPAFWLCQANRAAPHSVCNPGIREVKGTLFIHFSRLWNRAWYPHYAVKGTTYQMVY